MLRLIDNGVQRSFKLFLVDGVNYEIDIVKGNNIISTTHVNLEPPQMEAATGISGNMTVRSDIHQPSNNETFSFNTDRVGRMIEMCGFGSVTGLVDNNSGRVVGLVESQSEETVSSPESP